MCEKVNAVTDAQLAWAEDQTGKNKDEIIAYCLIQYLKNLQTPSGGQQGFPERIERHSGSRTLQ